MSKRYIIILAAVILLIASQLILVRLVYAHQIDGPWASALAKIYRLKAGTIERDQERLPIYLGDYFHNKELALKFFSAQYAKAQSDGQENYTMPTAEELAQIVWDKLVKDAWLAKMSKDSDIKVTKDDLEVYLAGAGDLASLQDEARTNYNLSFDDYKELVIKPFVLEAKIYDYLLGSFQDTLGAKKTQEAYGALEAGQKFAAVAQQYSDDKAYADKSIWLKESDLVDFYEPIRKLKPQEFSQIVIAPQAYIIWYLESIVTEKDQPVMYEVKAIFIKAKTVAEFLQDYLQGAQINRSYQK